MTKRCLFISHDRAISQGAFSFIEFFRDAALGCLICRAFGSRWFEMAEFLFVDKAGRPLLIFLFLLLGLFSLVKHSSKTSRLICKVLIIALRCVGAVPGRKI